MKPIKNFDNVKEFAAAKMLPAGAYICEIKKAEEVGNRNSSGTHLELSVEIAEGEYAGFFMADWKDQPKENRFWRGTYNQNVPQEGSDKYDNQCRFFKGFITCVVESNPGYNWNWDEATLVGKRVGIVFAEEEKESQKGTVYVVSKAHQVISLPSLKAGKYTIPERKKLKPKAGGGAAPNWLDVEYDPSDLDAPF